MTQKTPSPEHSKSHSPRQPRQSSTKNKSISASDSSMTKDFFFDYVKKEWKSDKRVPATVRVNKKLYLEFKQVSKALYGSTCRAVEAFMAVTVLSARQKAFFSHTVSQPVPIHIGEIHIERNLRPRRSLPLQDFEVHEESEAVVVQKSKKPVSLKALPDFSKFSTERLKQLHVQAKNSGQVGRSGLIAYELKKRGIY